MATHSSILAWKIPWTEELAGYSPQGRKESDMTLRVHFTDNLLPNRLLCPWDFPGKNTRVDCHFLLQGKPHGKPLIIYSIFLWL